MDISQNYNWVDCWERAKRSHCPFCFFIGARGTGKTYGSLKSQYEEYYDGHCGKYVYMRLTQTELDLCASDSDNPYKKHNKRYGWGVHFQPVAKSNSYDIVDEANDKEVIGTARALATFGNVRGSDFEDMTHIIFDEFNPTERVRKTPEIKKAGFLFNQAYETINRNRELEGEPPVIVLFLANSFTLDSSILNEFGIVSIIEGMQASGQKRCTIPERGIYIELCEAPDVTEAKRETALYKAMRGNKKLEAINLDNKFTDYNLTLVKKRVPLSEYVPAVVFEDITIYTHKSTDMLYARKGVETARERYVSKTRGLFIARWRQALKSAIMERRLYADTAATLYELEDALESPL